MDNRKRVITAVAGLLIAGVLIVYGISRGEGVIVLNKAINVCLECIGLG